MRRAALILLSFLVGCSALAVALLYIDSDPPTLGGWATNLAILFGSQLGTLVYLLRRKPGTCRLNRARAATG